MNKVDFETKLLIGASIGAFVFVPISVVLPAMMIWWLANNYTIWSFILILVGVPTTIGVGIYIADLVRILYL